MITVASATKYGPALVAPVALLDWRMAAGIALGFASGWMARTAAKVSTGASFEEIKRDLLVSMLITGGSLIFVLYLIRWMQLDTLGAAGVSFLLAWGGIRLVDSIGKDLTNWLRSKLPPPDDTGDDP